MANPIVPVGTLNRLRGSLTIISFPGLNVTAPYLGKEAMTLTFEGSNTTPIEAMTGIVTSPEPYQRFTARIHLLKTQQLANAWKQQYETLGLIGDFVIRLDSAVMDPYQISNGYISSLDTITTDGLNAGWNVMIGGTYYINSALWNY